VSRYQEGKTNLDFTEERDSEWQWHQLGHMQVCNSLQTDNHASSPPLSKCLSMAPHVRSDRVCAVYVVWTDAPRLSDVSTDSSVSDCSSLVKSFTSGSAPVASRARLDHLNELRLTEQAWWRRLGDEYQDSKYTDVDSHRSAQADDDHSWKVF